MQVAAISTAWALAVASAAPPAFEDDPPDGYRQFGEITEREPHDSVSTVSTSLKTRGLYC